ncbi:hypothetical protein Tsubulata_046463 [Turnera subulata]|uniref:Pentacotripeptide-repeat region of PRORP domain-containing protein n=1 Tax=Turnera subulata TaxID=218843 RepID=A0A9Q0FRH4_9ROSI|nr:hypothetical protein Tsubulata_046463 [Turnera subulata]
MYMQPNTVLLPVSSPRRHRHQPHCIPTKATVKSRPFHTSSSFSTSSATRTPILTKTPTQQPPLLLLHEITSLCQSNNLPEALTLLRPLTQKATSSPSQTKEAIGILLQACGDQNDIETGRQLHEIVSRSAQFRNDSVLNTRLVTMYAACGFPLDSKLVFDHIKEKNLFQWNALISGLVRNREYGEAVKVFVEMISCTELEPDNYTLPCVKANEVTILNVLPVCLEKSQLLRLKEIHGYSFRHGFQRKELVANALVAAYAKCGMLSYAEAVFHGILNKTVSSWNALISGYGQSGHPKKALDLYLKLTYSGLKPDCFTISSLLLAFGNLKSLHRGKEIHGFVLRNGRKHYLKQWVPLLSDRWECTRSSSDPVKNFLRGHTLTQLQHPISVIPDVRSSSLRINSS